MSSFSFRPIACFLFLHLTYPGALPWGAGSHTPSAKIDFEVKASGRSKTYYGLALSFDLWPTRSPSEHVQCLPCPKKREEQKSLHPLLSQSFVSLCPCHGYFPEMFTRDKDCLFLLLLPFWRENRRLAINSSAEGHPSLVSEHVNRGLVVNI